MSDFERLKRYLTYVPQCVLNRILRDPRPALGPTLRKLSGAVAYIHLPPHTLTFEQIAPLYESVAATVVDEFDGDVMCMSNACIVCLWDRERTSESLHTLTLRALHAMQRVRSLFASARFASLFNRPSSSSLLSLASSATISLLSSPGNAPSFSVARGALTLLFVGGVNGVWQFVLGGAPMVRTSVAAVYGPPDAIVLDEEDWHALEPFAHGVVAESLTGRMREGLVLIRGDIEASRTQPIKMRDSSRELDSRLQRRLEMLHDIEHSLFTYLAAPLVARMRNQEEQSVWLTDVRNITTVTIRLSALRYDEAHCDEVHSAVCALQSYANHFGGCLMSVCTRGNDTCAIVAFGLPPVQVENLPPLAASMALELLATFHRSASYVDVCAGVSTGRVVGGSVGCASRRAHLLCGPVVTDSLKLAILATPHTVLVDDATSNALSDNYLRFPGPESGSWVVSRRRSSATRVLPGDNHMLDDICADAQMGVLDALLDETALFVASGTARLVLVEGRIGLGKRRLVHVFLRALSETDFAGGGSAPLVLEARGETAEVNTPFYIWRAVFAQLMDAAIGESARGSFAALVQACPLLRDVYTNESPAVLKVLSSVLGALEMAPVSEAPLNASARLLADDSVYRSVGRVLFNLLIEFVHDASKVIVIGSGSYLDQHSWHLIQSLHNSAPSIMLVVFTRPADPLDARDTVHRQLMGSNDVLLLRMNDWSREHICRYVCAATNATELDAMVADLVIDRAQGNPFFACEMVLALVESGLVEHKPLVSAPAPVQATSSILMSPSAAAALSIDSTSVPKQTMLAPVAPDSLLAASVPFPLTMQGVIQKRVDLLSGAQQLVLRVAAVIGEVFEPQLLIDIMPLKVGIDVRRHISTLYSCGFFQKAMMLDKAFRLPSKPLARPAVVVLNDGQIASVSGDNVLFDAKSRGGNADEDESLTESISEEPASAGVNAAPPPPARPITGSATEMGGESAPSATDGLSPATDDAEDAENASTNEPSAEYSERYEYHSVNEESYERLAEASNASPIVAARLRADTNNSGSSLPDDDDDDDNELAQMLGSRAADTESRGDSKHRVSLFRSTLADLRSFRLRPRRRSGSMTSKTSPTASTDEEVPKKRTKVKLRVRVRRVKTMMRAGADDDTRSAESTTSTTGQSTSPLMQAIVPTLSGFEPLPSSPGGDWPLAGSGHLQRKQSSSSHSNWRTESPIGKSRSNETLAASVESSSRGAGGDGGSDPLQSSERRYSNGTADKIHLLQFSDPSMQRSVYDTILPSQRRQLHVLVAEWYETKHSADLEPYWALLAHHWSSAERSMLAHEPPTMALAHKAIFYLERAADRARLGQSYTVSIEYYMRLLRMARERLGLVERVKIVEWAFQCGRTLARLGQIDRAAEMCRVAIDTSGLEVEQAPSTLAKLYRRIVPARLRSPGGAGGSGTAGAGTSVTTTDATNEAGSSGLLLRLMGAVYLTQMFVNVMRNEVSAVADACMQCVTCGEKSGDRLQIADAYALMGFVKAAVGDASSALLYRMRALTELQSVTDLLVDENTLIADGSFDGHSREAQIMRVRLCVASTLMLSGYLTRTLRGLRMFERVSTVPEAGKAFHARSMCLWLLGRFSLAAVYSERAILIAPEDLSLRRWCLLRASVLATLGCPDVGSVVLEQERAGDAIMSGIDEEVQKVIAGHAPTTPGNDVVGYERFNFVAHAANVALAQGRRDECAAMLRIAAANPFNMCSGMHVGIALVTASDTSVRLAVLVAEKPSNCTLLSPAAALALAESHVRRLRTCNLRVLRGWQRLFDGYLALLNNKVSTAVDTWLEGVAEVKRELPLLPAIRAPNKLSRDSSASSEDMERSDDDEDESEAMSHDSLALELRRTMSLAEASSKVFPQQPHTVARHHSGPLVLPHRRVSWSDEVSPPDEPPVLVLNPSTRTSGLLQAVARGGLSAPLAERDRDGRDGRQVYVLARLYDALGMHLKMFRVAGKDMTQSKRIEYLTAAARLFGGSGAVADLRATTAALRAIKPTTVPATQAAAYWESYGGAKNKTT